MRIKSAKDLIVYLDVGGLPAGAVGTFNPNPATGSSTLTVTVSSGVSRGTYPHGDRHGWNPGNPAHDDGHGRKESAKV
ncbi:MAG TPA: hypothetical protein VN957_21640 [Chthoniobacterales bacterium]|jgi:hypothetical protein|nr:hypothetical protein [Chthoniobacterales bacterium]